MLERGVDQLDEQLVEVDQLLEYVKACIREYLAVVRDVHLLPEGLIDSLRRCKTHNFLELLGSGLADFPCRACFRLQVSGEGSGREEGHG